MNDCWNRVSFFFFFSIRFFKYIILFWYWLHTDAIMSPKTDKIHAFFETSCWNIELFCSKYFELSDFLHLVESICNCFAENWQNSLFSWLIFLCVQFLFKLVLLICSYVSRNWQELHVFRNWWPKHAIFCNLIS